MKRDLDLIRLLLMQAEGEQPAPDLSAYSEEQIVYHSALMIEAELVVGNIVEDQNGYPAGTTVIRLTWAGHEFLDAARDNTTWNKTTTKMKESGQSLSFEVVKALLVGTVKQHLGLGLGP